MSDMDNKDLTNEEITEEVVQDENCDEIKETKDEESVVEDNKEDKGFFKKKKDKEKEELKTKVDELNDRLVRKMAEFDNFRKRTEKEKASMYAFGAKDVVEKILPIVDNFERGLAQAPENDPFAEGMDMIYKQLLTTLEDLGVSHILAVGEEFNPDLHNAVMHIEDDNYGENIVVEEFQKGYKYKDIVVRHSMVKVAN